MIRISSGLLRGTQLASPTGKQTRPSSERLRQSIFNVLRNFRWSETDASIAQGAVVVDLFAGTGAWGIEAMSNGAAEVWFVEQHSQALVSLQENLNIAVRCFEAQNLEVPKIHLLRADAAQCYRKLPSTRLLFCDPPYDKGWFEKVLHLEQTEERIEKGGLFIYEASSKEKAPASPSNLRQFDHKIYGDSAVYFYIKD